MTRSCTPPTRRFNQKRRAGLLESTWRRPGISRHMQDFAQRPSPQFHRNQRGDRQNITRDVGDSYTGIGGRRQRRFKPFAHRFWIRRGPVVGIELPDRVEQREALCGDVLHRAQVFVGEERKQKTNERGRHSGVLFPQGGEREETADDQNVEIPIVLHRGGAIEIELDQFVVVHGRALFRGCDRRNRGKFLAG